MFVNKFKINISTLSGDTTATTITFPISMDFQNVDQAELIERVFVDTEVEASINPIVDNDRVRYLPLDLQGNYIDKIVYDIKLLNKGSYVDFYGDIGFSDDDIKYRKNYFLETNVTLNFYDSDNPLTQKLVSYLTLYSNLNSNDFLDITVTNGIPGKPKPAVQIPVNFILENPILNPRGFAEGFHMYDYKDELKIDEWKYLYMRASFKNAKTGKNVNLMVTNQSKSIDKLVHELYTRYKLIRKKTGYYYEIDDSFQGNLDNLGNVVTGPNNVMYATNTVYVKLYEIKST